MTNIELHNDLKQMSQDIYKKDKSPNLNGWTKISDSRNDKTGFHGEVYQKGKELVIVFEGTDLKSPRDVFQNDGLLVLNKRPPQMEDATKYYNTTKEAFNDHHITVTGHSLGGTICQILSHETGADAVTFNAYGAGKIINSDTTPDNVINYGHANDRIFGHNMDHHYGKTYVLSDYDCTDGKEYEYGGPKSLRPHSIENMGDIAKAKEYTPPKKGGMCLPDENPDRIITNAEIGRMSDEEFKQKEKYIDQQMQRGKVVMDEPNTNISNATFNKPFSKKNDSGFVNAVSNTPQQQENTAKTRMQTLWNKAQNKDTSFSNHTENNTTAPRPVAPSPQKQTTHNSQPFAQPFQSPINAQPKTQFLDTPVGTQSSGINKPTTTSFAPPINKEATILQESYKQQEPRITSTPEFDIEPHIFTIKELDGMSQETFDKNLSEIERQISKGLIR